MDQASTPPLEITLPTALELCQLGMGTLIDIRQAFELDDVRHVRPAGPAARVHRAFHHRAHDS